MGGGFEDEWAVVFPGQLLQKAHQTREPLLSLMFRRLTERQVAVVMGARARKVVTHVRGQGRRMPGNEFVFRWHIQRLRHVVKVPLFGRESREELGHEGFCAQKRQWVHGLKEIGVGEALVLAKEVVEMGGAAAPMT